MAGHKDRIGLGHVFFAAFTTRRQVSDVVNRLTELRFDVAPVRQPPDWIDDLRPDTAKVLLQEPLFRVDGTVAPAWVAYAAARWEIPPREAAKRLADLAHPVPGDDELPDHLDQHDTILLTYLLSAEANAQNVSVSPRTLLAAARQANRTPTDVAARLAVLGFDVPPEEVLARMADATDLWLVEHVTPVRENWEDPRDALRPLVEAVWRLRIPLSELEERLSALGYADLVASTLPPDQSIPLAYALSGPTRTGLPASKIPDFLGTLGLSTSPAMPSLDWSDVTNTKLVENLDHGITVSVRKVIRLALMYDMTIAEVVRRLSGLGLEVPDMATELPALVARVPSRPRS
jgi:hypothetical protein